MDFWIVKFLIFDRFLNLFEFSRKLTSQIWICGFIGDPLQWSSSELAATHKIFLHKNLPHSESQIFKLFESSWKLP